jgi:pyruvate/2-oxoglutarate/acetoin dehydrogenase E1 component
MKRGAKHQTVTQAARQALADTMAADDTVVVIGEDVASGGPFGLTKQLAERHGAERVRNTPISEGAVMGVAVGLALAGGRPVVDLMFNDFVTAASDQLFNHAAKLHFMGGGRAAVPITVWTTGGAGTRWAAQHSQRLDGWFAAVPGLKLLAPASPAATYAAVSAAVADPDPVIVFADRSRLLTRDPLPGDEGEIDPWRSRTVRRGGRLTLATTGRLVHLACVIADEEQLDVEVVDLQRLAPLDVEGVLTSLDRTGRLLLVHDEAAPGAMTAMLATAVVEQGFWLLDAPIARLIAPATPVPAGAELEDAHVIDADDLKHAIERTLVS